MSEPRIFPFGSVPIYNPQSLSKGEALAQFHARQAAYQSLMDLLREEHPSHVLIIGTRGMGKTTLLQRVRYGVEDDSSLNGRYLALVFPEEQYNVNRLHFFLLNTLDALADAMERLHNERMLKLVEEYAERIGKLGQEEIEKEVPKFLTQVGQEVGRNLLLLVDNADRLFETIEPQEQWRLRELLSNRQDLTLFGATTQASDGIYGSDRAFFEFFKIYRLAPLSLEEVRELLLQLSESVEEEEGEKGTAKRRVEEWLAADASRLRTLVQLTGGNPRTTVLLFHLVLDGLAGGAREYLEQLLDQCTPNYKGRVDELPPQAQQVFDAVSLRWDPVTASEVAEDSGLETSAVSTQLTRLVRQGLLEKADPGDSKKALYQVAERFFNIWYLMRASRRVRAKLRWFVEFLRVFFDSGELEKMAWERLEGFRSARRMRSTEIETVFAYAFASGADRNRFEEYLRRECADREEEWLPFLDLSGIPKGHEVLSGRKVGPPSNSEELRTERDNHNDMDALRKALETEPGSAQNWRRLGLSFIAKEELTEAEAAFRKAIEVDPMSPQSWEMLGVLLGFNRERREEARSAVRKAIELNPSSAGPWLLLGTLLGMTPERRDDAESAFRKAIELEPDLALPWDQLGDMLCDVSERRDEAEAAYRKAIAIEPKNPGFWNDLGKLLGRTPERRAEAEAAHRKAIEFEPESALFWNSLGDVLAEIPERLGEAEAAYRKGLALEPKNVALWNDLGTLLAKMPDKRAEAEAAYKKAIELDPNEGGFWSNLGNVLDETPERREESETAYRKATELSPKEAGSWSNLGNFLGKTPERRKEAEAAHRHAIELEPNDSRFWVNLGRFLEETPERWQEAETAYRKAIDLDPTATAAWVSLAYFLTEIPERREDAEVALRRAIELDPTEAGPWVHLGTLLDEMPERKEAAEVAYRKAIEVNPSKTSAWVCLGNLLAETRERRDDAEMAFKRALEIDPGSGWVWGMWGVFLACSAGRPKEAEYAFRKSEELEPNSAATLRNLGVLLYCEIHEEREAIHLLRRAAQLEPTDPVSAAILVACARGSEFENEGREIFREGFGEAEFWEELLRLCRNYAPFGKILLGICDLVQERDRSNSRALLYRAVALAQLGDFPRASSALEDALVGDPIEQLSVGRRALEVFFAAAVRRGRVQDCLELLDRKEWKDAWRPIYEALKAVEVGSAEYLKRIAVEIREPALTILRRIAPGLEGLKGR